MLKNFVNIFHCIVISNFVLITMRTKFMKFCSDNQRDRRDPTASTRHFVARSLRDVGYTSFGHDFQELGVAASSGVLDPVLKIKRIESLRFQNFHCTCYTQTQPRKFFRSAIIGGISAVAYS